MIQNTKMAEAHEVQRLNSFYFDDRYFPDKDLIWLPGIGFRESRERTSIPQDTGCRHGTLSKKKNSPGTKILGRIGTPNRTI
jgi:hypothetical protein